MKTEYLIPLAQLSTHYEVETSFLVDLHEYGFIVIETVEEAPFLHPDQLMVLEKAIRLHHDLHLNLEGIDVALQLLRRIEVLQAELSVARSRLRYYED